jgi:hypothetical protein
LQREVGDAGRLHRAVHRLFILFAPAGKQRLVRIAPAGHQLLHRDIARRGGVLRQQPDAAGHLFAGKALDLLAVENTLPSTGVIRRLRVRSSVDLPQPFGPIIAVKWPSGWHVQRSAMVFLP